MLVGSSRQGLATEFKHPHSKPGGGMGINYIIRFLDVLQTERRAAELYRLSPYRFKRGTLDIIKWCMERKLVERKIQFKSSFKNRKDPKIFYKITDSGREFLKVIR